MEGVAQAYVDKGYVPFSVSVSTSGNKKLIRPPTKWSDFTLASPNRIRRSHNGLALRTGPVGTGLLVLDVDNVESWEDYLASNGRQEPETVVQLSQSGGRHLFFQWQDRFSTLRSTSKVLKHNGAALDVDLRSTGGMLLVSPTQVTYPDGTVRQYTWAPGRALVGEGAIDPSQLPEWLWEELVKNAPGMAGRKQRKTASATVTAGEKSVETTTPNGLVDFIVDNYGFLPGQLEKILYMPESKTFVVQTNERKCLFLRKTHSSNHQYFVIKENGEIARQCHDGDCKGKQHGKKVLTDEIVRELQGLFPEESSADAIDMTLVEQARVEAKQNIIENFKGNETMQIERHNDTLRGTLHTMLGLKCCPECKTGTLNSVTNAKGLCVVCSKCEYRFPQGPVIPFDHEKYPNLSKYFLIINFNSGNTTTINNYSTEDLYLNWNEFSGDNLQVIEDRDTNLLLLESLSGTHSRVAAFFAAMYPTNFVYVEVDKKAWYTFTGTSWLEVKEWVIKKKLHDRDFLTNYLRALETYASSTVQKKDQKMKQIQSLMAKLESETFQANVLSQCVHYYGEKGKSFLENLDKDRNLLGFTNGVFDLAANKFRPGQPDDFITKNVGFEYDEAKMNDPEITKDIETFFEQVFPEREVCQYVFKFLASLLAGFCREQLTHFGWGQGSNGKGVLLQLMQRVLGEYAQKTESSFLCGSCPDANAPTPALTALVGKRFVYVSEVVEGSKLNEALFKQLSGQDRLSYRPLYGEVKTFDPEFRLFMVVNHLPKFNASDYALRRRIRVIPFVSTFKDGPTDPSLFQFPKDDGIIDRLDTWRHAMMGLLLRNYQVYLAEGLSEVPTAISKFTKDYQVENDVYQRFVSECLIQDPNSGISTDALITAFDIWRVENDVEGRFGRNTVLHGIEEAIHGKKSTHDERKGKIPGERKRAGLGGFRLVEG